MQWSRVSLFKILIRTAFCAVCILLLNNHLDLIYLLNLSPFCHQSQRFLLYFYLMWMWMWLHWLWPCSINFAIKLVVLILNTPRRDFASLQKKFTFQYLQYKCSIMPLIKLQKVITVCYNFFMSPYLNIIPKRVIL